MSYRVYDKVCGKYFTEQPSRRTIMFPDGTVSRLVEDGYDIYVMEIDQAKIDIEYGAGYKDVNGKEIMAGDRVKFHSDHLRTAPRGGFKGVVEYNDGSFVAAGEGGGYYLFNESGQWEIIGNAHDNQEANP